MTLLHVIICLVVVGVVLYLINKFVPMEAKIKSVLNWTVVIFVIIWFLKVLGALDFLSSIKL